MSGINEKAGMNPGGWIGMGLFGCLVYAFVGWWVLVPMGIILLITFTMPGVVKMMNEDSRRKRNARKMRRELRMGARMDLAAEYARRHPDKA